MSRYASPSVVVWRDLAQRMLRTRTLARLYPLIQVPLEAGQHCLETRPSVFFNGNRMQLEHPGPALSRCNCIGPRASGGPAAWYLCRLFIFARYTVRLRIQ